MTMTMTTTIALLSLPLTYYSLNLFTYLSVHCCCNIYDRCPWRWNCNVWRHCPRDRREWQQSAVVGFDADGRQLARGPVHRCRYRWTPGEYRYGYSHRYSGNFSHCYRQGRRLQRSHHLLITRRSVYYVSSSSSSSSSSQ